MSEVPYAYGKKKTVVSEPQPKPCPTCYAPMRLVVDVFVCVKHGEPTRP